MDENTKHSITELLARHLETGVEHLYTTINLKTLLKPDATQDKVTTLYTQLEEIRKHVEQEIELFTERKSQIQHITTEQIENLEEIVDELVEIRHYLKLGRKSSREEQKRQRKHINFIVEARRIHLLEKQINIWNKTEEPGADKHLKELYSRTCAWSRRVLGREKKTNLYRQRHYTGWENMGENTDQKLSILVVGRVELERSGYQVGADLAIQNIPFENKDLNRTVLLSVIPENLYNSLNNNLEDENEETNRLLEPLPFNILQENETTLHVAAKLYKENYKTTFKTCLDLAHKIENRKPVERKVE